MQYFGKTEIQKRPALFRNPQSFVNCSMEMSIRYNFFIDLESIQHKDKRKSRYDLASPEGKAILTTN